MAQSERSKPLHALFNLLKDDWKTLNGKYPDQALFALEDNRVTAAIEKRFDDKASLKNIRSLPYSFESGLNSIYFEFSSDAKGAGTILTDAFLILIDGNCKVVAIIDPFDPDRPNAFTPQSFKQGEQPFVLARPSVTDELAFSDGDLLAVRMRSREFFLKIGGGGGDLEIYTSCSYWTDTNLGRDHYNDRTVDDCGQQETILA